MKLLVFILSKLYYTISYFYRFFTNKSFRRTCYYSYYAKKKIRKNYVLYESFHGTIFGGNPYAIFKYLIEHEEYDNLYHIISVKDLNHPIAKRYSKNPRVKLVVTNSRKYIKYLETSKYVINNTTFRPEQIKREEQYYINTWHATLLKSLGAHTNRVWEARNLTRNFLKANMLVMPNKYTQEILLDAYYIRDLYDGKLTDFGYPRNDLAFHSDKEKIRKIMNVPSGKKIILYAPTWRGEILHPTNVVNTFINLYNEIKSKISDDYVIYLKLHSMVYRYITDDIKKIVVPFDIDTLEILSITDVLITDYSGTLFDMMVCGKPTILFQPDLEDYVSDRGNFYLPLDSLPFPKCYDTDNLCAIINDIDNIFAKYESEYKKFVRRFIYADSGNSCQKLAESVFDNIEGNQIITNEITKKKKILFCISGLSNSEMESLIDTLNSIDYDEYCVSILFKYWNLKKEFQLKINKNVNLFYLEGKNLYDFSEYVAINSFILSGILKKSTIRKIKECAEKNMKRFIPNCQFDTVISYCSYNTRFNSFVACGISSKRKVLILNTNIKKIKSNKKACALSNNFFDEVYYYKQKNNDYFDYSKFNSINLTKNDLLKVMDEKLNKEINYDVSDSPSVDAMMNKLLKYDIISFDIFDTLVFRPFSKPNDLFKALGMKYNLTDFNNVRTMASKEARKKMSHGEVFIEDIYKEVNIMTNIDIDSGVKLEFEAEKNICYANPYFLEIFKRLLKAQKKIIVISDMYYQKNRIEEILNKCGYKGYSDLFVSCEYKMSKKNGDLFKYVCKKYKGKKVVHIGNSYDSDIKPLKYTNWVGYHYQNPTSLDNIPTRNQMSYIIGSVYNALVQNHFYNNLINIEDKKYYYSYTLAGLLALGYTNYIHDYASKNGFSKILFLSRDGYILKEIYDKLYSDIPSEYIYWSRVASTKTMLDTDLKYFIFQFINRRKKQKCTVETILKDAELTFLIPNLQKRNIHQNQIIDNEICNVIVEVIKENIDKVRNIGKKYQEAAKKYFTPILNNCNKVLIVDIGWKGSSIISIKHLIENVWKMPIEVKGIMVGNYAYKKGYDTSLVNNQNIITYAFSEMLNTDYALIHGRYIEVSNSINEVFFTAPHPSFLYYKMDNDKVVPIFEENDNRNLNHLNTIHKGIMDFVDDYVDKTKFFPELLNISGRDAYTPIMNILKNNDELIKFADAFSDYDFNVMVGGLTNDEQSNSLETLIKNSIDKNKKEQSIIQRNVKKLKNIIKKIINKV